MLFTDVLYLQYFEKPTPENVSIHTEKNISTIRLMVNELFVLHLHAFCILPSAYHDVFTP